MSSEPNLFVFLTQTPAIAALVGDRVYAELIPQHVFEGVRKMPCVVFRRDGGVRQVKFCGTDRLVQGQYQVDAYALTYEEKCELADAIRRRMVDYSGPMGSVTVNQVTLASDPDVGPDPEPGLYRRMQLFQIWYVED